MSRNLHWALFVDWPRETHNIVGFWSPQVVVALEVIRKGLPVRCRVLPGNTSDVNMVERVRTALRNWQQVDPLQHVRYA